MTGRKSEDEDGATLQLLIERSGEEVRKGSDGQGRQGKMEGLTVAEVFFEY